MPPSVWRHQISQNAAISRGGLPAAEARVLCGRTLRLAQHVTRAGEIGGAYRVLVGRPEGNRPLGRPRCRGKGIPLQVWTGISLLFYFFFYFKDLLHRNSLKYMWGYKIVPTANLPHYHSKYSYE